MLAERVGAGHFDDLKQRILDDGVGQTGRDIGDGRALLLRLLDLRVHKDRTARAQIDRVFCEKRLAGEVLYGYAERFGESLDEGAAARGTGLVELD